MQTWIETQLVSCSFKWNVEAADSLVLLGVRRVRPRPGRRARPANKWEVKSHHHRDEEKENTSAVSAFILWFCFELTCFPGDPIIPTTPGSPVTPWRQRQHSLVLQHRHEEAEFIVAPLLIVPLTHCGLSGQKRRANPARRKMVSNINIWAREEKSHSVSDESGMVRGQRSHLQEVLVGQHHLEPHFYLEDPEKQQKGSEKGRKSDPDWRLSA